MASWSIMRACSLILQPHLLSSCLVRALCCLFQTFCLFGTFDRSLGECAVGALVASWTWWIGLAPQRVLGRGKEKEHAHYGEVHLPDHGGDERKNQGRKHRTNDGEPTREPPAGGSILRPHGR